MTDILKRQTDALLSHCDSQCRDDFDQLQSCEICQEDGVIPIYKNICANCHLKTYKYNLHKTEELELYTVVNDLQHDKTQMEKLDDNIYLKFLNELMELKRDLGKRLAEKDKFNSLIESKCPKCEHSKIIKKKIIFGNDPHPLKCENDHEFCSNCQLLPHANTDKKYYVTCEQYRHVHDTFHDSFTQMWISGIKNNNEEHKKFIELGESEEKSLSYLRNVDCRICPYVNYDTAAKYEKITGVRSGLIETHNKKNWHKVACKSVAVTQTDCSDMFCGQHNPERIGQMMRNGKKISEKMTGCGRQINWAYWTTFTKQFDKKKYGIHKMPQSDIADVTRSYGILENPMRCGYCGKKTTCVHIKCTHHNCKFNNYFKCGNCIVDQTIYTFPEIETVINITKQKFNEKTQKYEDDDEKYIFKKNRKGVYTCIFEENTKMKLLYITKNGTILYCKNNAIFGRLYDNNCQQTTQIYTKHNYSKTYFSKGNEQRKFKQKYIVKFFFRDNIWKKFNKKCTFDNCVCTDDNHVWKVFGLDDLKTRINNINDFKPSNEAAKKINRFIKRKIIFNKWFELIKDKFKMNERMKKGKQEINKLFRRPIVRKRWNWMIHTIIERLDKLKKIDEPVVTNTFKYTHTDDTDYINGDISIRKADIDCCIIC